MRGVDGKKRTERKARVNFSLLVISTHFNTITSLAWPGKQTLHRPMWPAEGSPPC